jgi:hypothetical protein
MFISERCSSRYLVWYGMVRYGKVWYREPMVVRGRFVLPCPGPSRGNRNLVVVAAQGAPHSPE